MDLLIILIAVSLSMDAFSLALAYGMAGVRRREKILVPITVGVFHFFMPLIGLTIGNVFLKQFMFDYNLLIFLILTLIGVQMILDSFKERETNQLKNFEIFLFAFAVSIDSFSVGITLTDIGENFIISALTFAITSSFFTYIGLSLGNKIANFLGKISTIIGGLILIVIGLVYLF